MLGRRILDDYYGVLGSGASGTQAAGPARPRSGRRTPEVTTLADHVRILPRFARSANLERDSGQSQPLEGYVVTARALEAVDRILKVAGTQQAGGAWSLTGPYGSGKSSLALLLDALLGPDGATRDAAVGLVEAADPDMADSVWMAHDNHGTQETGFHRGLVTASREPLNLTVLRGLHSAVLAAFGRIPSRRRFPAVDALKTALSDAASDDPRRTGPVASRTDRGCEVPGQ